jgi:hypothetical protein
MSWEELLKYNPTGMNSIIDYISEMRDILSEMESITRESFPTSTDEPIQEFNAVEAARLWKDYERIYKDIKVYWLSMIKQGDMA